MGIALASRGGALDCVGGVQSKCEGGTVSNYLEDSTSAMNNSSSSSSASSVESVVREIEEKPQRLDTPPVTQAQLRLRKTGLTLSLICPDCRDPSPKIVENFSAGDLLCGDCGKLSFKV